MVIEHIFPARATDAIYKLCGILQSWKRLSKWKDRTVIDKLTRKHKEVASRLMMVTYPP